MRREYVGASDEPVEWADPGHHGINEELIGRVVSVIAYQNHQAGSATYCNFVYSALASFRTGMLGSASFRQRKKILIRPLGFRSFTLQHVGAGEATMGESADGISEFPRCSKIF